jgi:hypothetical protein
LQRLLAGSGLSYRFTDATTVTLERTVAQEASPVPLAPVTMTGKLYVGVENLLNTKYVNRTRSFSTSFLCTSTPTPAKSTSRGRGSAT